MDLSRFYFVSNSLYEFLSRKEIEFLKKFTLQKNYSKGSDIFNEGAYPKGVYILDKGKVKIYQKTYGGSQRIMNVHVQGEIFGYRPLLCDEKYPVTATALEGCKISLMPKKQFLTILKRSPSLSNALLRFLSYEFTVWVNTISILTQRTVKERLLLNLLILAEKYRKKEIWPVEITLSRADLAALIGTSNETLARMIRALKDEKYLSTRGRTIVLNGPAQIGKIRRSLSGIF